MYLKNCVLFSEDLSKPPWGIHTNHILKKSSVCIQKHNEFRKIHIRIHYQYTTFPEKGKGYCENFYKLAYFCIVFRTVFSAMRKIVQLHQGKKSKSN